MCEKLKSRLVVLALEGCFKENKEVLVLHCTVSLFARLCECPFVCLLIVYCLV